MVDVPLVIQLYVLQNLGLFFYKLSDFVITNLSNIGIVFEYTSISNIVVTL